MSKRWRYRLNKRFSTSVPELTGVSFKNEWLTIENRRLTINAGYTWDGCTPARPLFGGLWIGVWDGPLMEDGRPASWTATLVHDALCQFKHEIVVEKKSTVDLFRRLLKESGAPSWMVVLYPAAVNIFGPSFL